MASIQTLCRCHIYLALFVVSMFLFQGLRSQYFFKPKPLISGMLLPTQASSESPKAVSPQAVAWLNYKRPWHAKEIGKLSIQAQLTQYPLSVTSEVQLRQRVQTYAKQLAAAQGANAIATEIQAILFNQGGWHYFFERKALLTGQAQKSLRSQG